MAPDLVTLDSIVICDEQHDQQAPTVAYGDSVYLVSWLDKRGAYPAIYSARVMLDGTVIEQNGFMLHADSMTQIAPVSAFDGDNFLIVWIGFDAAGFGVYAKRVSPSGTIVDSIPIELCYGAAPKYNPSVSFDGSNYMVIWDDARMNGSEYDEWCARISKGGVLLDTSNIPVDTSLGFQSNPSIAYRAPYFLAVWTDEQSGEADLVGKRIRPNGTVVEGTAIPISNVTGAQLAATVFAGDENYFACWEDGRSGYEHMDIYGTFVDSAGTGVPGNTVMPQGTRADKMTAVPNPFRKEVTIRYGTYIGTSGLRIQIFDMCGRMVREGFMHPRKACSSCSFVWNGRDNQGHEVATGIYHVILSGQAVRMKQAVLLLRE